MSALRVAGGLDESGIALLRREPHSAVMTPPGSSALGETPAAGEAQRTTFLIRAAHAVPPKHRQQWRLGRACRPVPASRSV